jgi:hypothetical protein
MKLAALFARNQDTITTLDAMLLPIFHPDLVRQMRDAFSKVPE